MFLDTMISNGLEQVRACSFTADATVPDELDGGVALTDPQAPPAINRDKEWADKCRVAPRWKAGSCSAIFGKFSGQVGGNLSAETIESGIRRSFNHYYNKLGHRKIDHF
ncbi:MAG: hypothetical protein R3D83_02095 [Caenibius sp.]